MATDPKPPRRLAGAGWRIYQNFLMPSRLPAYRGLLQAARAHGYAVLAVDAAWDAMQVPAGETVATAAPTAMPATTLPTRTLVLRHDIDTDPATAVAMARIDADEGVRTSYFFRLATAHAPSIQVLMSLGHHVSYHFEEWATVMKARRARDAAGADACLAPARDLFAQNLSALRARFGLPLDIVCSHGDWINRRLARYNETLLADPALRARCGVRLECYDAAFTSGFACNLSDAARPSYWATEDPLAAIAAGTGPIGLLVHPREWRASWAANAREDWGRFREGRAWRQGGRG